MPGDLKGLTKQQLKHLKRGKGSPRHLIKKYWDQLNSSRPKSKHTEQHTVVKPDNSKKIKDLSLYEQQTTMGSLIKTRDMSVEDKSGREETDLVSKKKKTKLRSPIERKITNEQIDRKHIASLNISRPISRKHLESWTKLELQRLADDLELKLPKSMNISEIQSRLFSCLKLKETEYSAHK